MTLRVFEAFAGVGSQRMALRNLGIDHEVVAIAEIDKFAIKSYEAIHGEIYNLGDISRSWKSWTTTTGRKRLDGKSERL